MEDILEAIDDIEKSTGKISFEVFSSDKDIRDANLRRIEIIGEAAKGIPEAIRRKYPDVPWKAIAGFRDVLIHSYFVVNLERTWNVIKKDLPALKKRTREILEKEDAQ